MNPATSQDKENGVYFLTKGKGCKVLFVHGSGADHTLWGNQIKALSSQFRISALDLNGHGRTKYREGAGLKIYTQDVLSCINKLCDKPFLVGHSLGGAIALNIGLNFSHKVVGLGLIGTGARLRVLPELLELIEKNMERAVDFILERAFSADPDLKMVEKSRKMMLKSRQAVLLRDFKTCDFFDIMDRLDQIDLPTIVICGEEDKLTPVKYSCYLAENIPDASLKVIKRAGHMVMIEKPEEVNKILTDFLKDELARPLTR